MNSFQIQKNYYQFFQNNKAKLLQSSQIITNQTQLFNLINFFHNKITDLTLQYCASENSFSMSKYYQKCGNLPNTIILVKTDKNKKLGGYTPLTFNPVFQLYSESVADHKKESFVFSLSQNIKMPLIQSSYAITRSSSKQFIYFGNGQLVIYDNAQQCEQNKSYLGNRYYYNEKFNDDQETYLKINGNKGRYFKVDEWEVWRVQGKGGNVWGGVKQME